jgi:hypothetical protein
MRIPEEPRPVPEAHNVESRMERFLRRSCGLTSSAPGGPLGLPSDRLNRRGLCGTHITQHHRGWAMPDELHTPDPPPERRGDVHVYSNQPAPRDGGPGAGLFVGLVAVVLLIVVLWFAFGRGGGTIIPERIDIDVNLPEAPAPSVPQPAPADPPSPPPAAPQGDP